MTTAPPQPVEPDDELPPWLGARMRDALRDIYHHATDTEDTP